MFCYPARVWYNAVSGMLLLKDVESGVMGNKVSVDIETINHGV